MSKRVAVLMGGWSAEREVSLSSGTGCADGLRKAGYTVIEVDVTKDIAKLLKALKPKPDAVFNALHGPIGEDGRIQSLLDMLEIPYTHSGVAASAMAMDKTLSRKLLIAASVPVPPGDVLTLADLRARGEPQRPYVVKPINEGSSVGVQLVFEEDEPGFGYVPDDWADDTVLIVETFVPGREIQTAVMGDKALGSIEIRTDRRFYDYIAKYTPGASTHYMPAPIHETAYDETLDLSIRAHRALGCRGISRVDLRYDDTQGEPGTLHVLEVNTQPGMTPTSLVPEIALHLGISFEELVAWCVENATWDA